MKTKLLSKTLQAILVIALKAKEDPKCKFTSLVHLLTKEFLKECFRELNRGKSPGIDGVTIGEYDEQLEFTLGIAKNELDLDGMMEWIRRHAKVVL